MTANLDMTNGRANIAFLGSRKDVWHRMGQEMAENQSIEEWTRQAGLAWEAIKVPAIAQLTGERFAHIPVERRLAPISDRSFIVRSDNGSVLGYVSGQDESNGYRIVQPAEVLDWFQRYIAVDDHFKLDVCGSLDGGKQIWATALYNGGIDVAGEKHAARVLMSTTFDCSGATINQCTMTRTVCENTLRMSHADKRAMVKTRHSTKFDAAKVGKELAQLAQGFANYKAIGDALAQHHLAQAEISQFFKACLDIPFDAKAEDISTRKMNQFRDVSKAFTISVREGAENNSAWAALQAITRYVDHSRSVQNGDNSVERARFESANFGSGDLLKGKALNLLLPLIKDKVAIAC